MFDEKLNDGKMHLTYDASDLPRKFSTGVFREKLDVLLRDDGFQKYFGEKLCTPCKKAVEELPEGQAKEFMKETTAIMNLWFNLRINIMQNAMRRAFMSWLRFDGDIDKVLEDSLTVDFGKQMIDAFADTTLTMIEKSEEIFENITSADKKSEGASKEKDKKRANTNKKSFLN